jgi:hypothetical protein
MSMEDYYETQSVKAGQSSYTCECCGKTIGKGKPSEVHKFYPEFHEYRTHLKCSEKFLDGEWCVECGDWFPKEELNKDDVCKECEEESKDE